MTDDEPNEIYSIHSVGAQVEYRGITASVRIIDDHDYPDHVRIVLEIHPAMPGLHYEAYSRLQRAPLRSSSPDVGGSITTTTS